MYIKNTVEILKLPHVVDLRGFPDLSKKIIDEGLNEQDYLYWLRETGRKVEYITKKIRKDRLSRALRTKVFQRDCFTCKTCFSTENLSVDHIKPEILGGTLDFDNLQTLCRKCNSSKGAKYTN